MSADTATWGEFAAAHPALAFGAECLTRRPAYLATLTAEGQPRVHPVTPIISAQHLFLFMEPTSPKGHDLRERGGYALHNGVPDNQGTGGEFTSAARRPRLTTRRCGPAPPARPATNRQNDMS